MFEKYASLRFVVTECSKHFAADQFSVHLKVAKMRIYDRIKLKPDAKLTMFIFLTEEGIYSIKIECITYFTYGK